MNLKKSLSEEIEVVKQLDAERRAFKEAPAARRVASPPIHAKSSFVFQPLDEYPTSSAAPIDDPDVWRPPSRDTTTRRPTRASQVGMRKSPQDGAWARGASTRTGTTGRGAKTAASSRVNSGVRASTTGKRGTGTGTGKSGKGDSAVSFLLSMVVRVFCKNSSSLSILKEKCEIVSALCSGIFCFGVCKFFCPILNLS